MPLQQPLAVRRALLATGLMVGASALAYSLRPRSHAGEAESRLDLEVLVPKTFGGWAVDATQAQPLVNPQTQELLDKLYNQILSRTYLGPQGERVMLSLAYGGDQRSSLQAHMPEVCYPAQGFKLLGLQDGTIDLPAGHIPVRRLMTELGPRKEPLTYWFTMGGATVKSTWDKRLVQLRLLLTGQIPDGLLFRVSTLDADPQAGWAAQQRFVADLMAAVDAPTRIRLAGLAPAP
ncbi:exosortase-associated protein EpsI, B-type [Aquariibacter albus]|nr:exosortase-associated protein EpsI, B-type [Aquariibacter albus]